MVLDDNNNQLVIELACRKQMYIGHGLKQWQIKDDDDVDDDDEKGHLNTLLLNGE